MKKLLILILSIIVGNGCFLLTACVNDGGSPSSIEKRSEQSINDESTSIVDEQSAQSSEEKTSRTPVEPISDGGGFQGGDYMN